MSMMTLIAERVSFRSSSIRGGSCPHPQLVLIRRRASNALQRACVPPSIGSLIRKRRPQKCHALREPVGDWIVRIDSDGRRQDPASSRMRRSMPTPDAILNAFSHRPPRRPL
jgi:hypothetical protein